MCLDLVTFVAGGCGIVGSGIVESLVKNGAKCWVASRDVSRLDTLKQLIPADLHDNLSLVNADISKESECVRLRDEIIKKDGKLNHVVASIGGWRTIGNLSTLSPEVFQKEFSDLTLPHFICYRTFAKYLSENPLSSYTFVSLKNPQR